MIEKCLECLGCERDYFLTRRVMPLPTYRAMIFLILREKGVQRMRDRPVLPPRPQHGAHDDQACVRTH